MTRAPGARTGPAAGVDYLALGHVTADLDDDGVATPGGAVTYASAVAADLGLRTAVVTRARAGFPPEGSLPGVSLHVVPAEATTTFRNRYDAEGRRSQELLSVASPLEADDVPTAWRHVGVLHVAPVVHEVSPDVVARVDADFVGLTPQGWLRDALIGAPVRPQPWRVPDEILARADAVVLSDEDLAHDEARIPWLADRVAVVVVTRGIRGAQAFFGGRSVFQPAVSAVASHPTGAGDSFAAALFTRLWERADAPSALCFAAAVAAYAVEGPGPARLPDRDRIARRAGLL